MSSFCLFNENCLIVLELSSCVLVLRRDFFYDHMASRSLEISFLFNNSFIHSINHSVSAEWSVTSILVELIGSYTRAANKSNNVIQIDNQNIGSRLGD